MFARLFLAPRPQQSPSRALHVHGTVSRGTSRAQPRPRVAPSRLARAQLELLGAYQHRLDAALARANLQGEAARGEEQLRLFAGP